MIMSEIVTTPYDAFLQLPNDRHILTFSLVYGAEFFASFMTPLSLAY